MAKNHNADISNPNRGTSGTNRTYQAAQNNRANQLNRNHAASKGSKKQG